MNAKEETVKGIVLASFPQGEYGKRLSVLTDRFGKITVFAAGAAKQDSKFIGAVRPMTCATLGIVRGRSAWNLRTAGVIEAFDAPGADPDLLFSGMYLMELADWFAQEGMEEQEAKMLLNLLFVSLKALFEGALPAELVRSMCTLRMLVIEGEYTSLPLHRAPEKVSALWEHTVKSPLSGLYRIEGPSGETVREFCSQEEVLRERQIPHAFRSLRVLREDAFPL